ncbi:MAG: hypothetical protein LBG67_01150 [Campylobacteraceae bacterium]|jgi:uncharacterized lipoprotein YehR (DUF1307 family)|nr:hypothetical protein [Campylobacteraceae bacterium]
MKKLFLIIASVLVLSFNGCSDNSTNIKDIKDVEEAYMKYAKSIGAPEQEIERIREGFKKPEVREATIKEMDRYKSLGYSRKEAIELILSEADKKRKKRVEQKERTLKLQKKWEDELANPTPPTPMPW